MYTLPSVHDVFHCNRRKTMLYYIFSINTVNIKVVSRNFDDWGGGGVDFLSFTWKLYKNKRENESTFP